MSWLDDDAAKVVYAMAHIHADVMRALMYEDATYLSRDLGEMRRYVDMLEIRFKDQLDDRGIV